jgi:hypothetical protein
MCLVIQYSSPYHLRPCMCRMVNNNRDRHSCQRRVYAAEHNSKEGSFWRRRKRGQPRTWGSSVTYCWYTISAMAMKKGRRTTRKEEVFISPATSVLPVAIFESYSAKKKSVVPQALQTNNALTLETDISTAMAMVVLLSSQHITVWLLI